MTSKNKSTSTFYVEYNNDNFKLDPVIGIYSKKSLLKKAKKLDIDLDDLLYKNYTDASKIDLPFWDDQKYRVYHLGLVDEDGHLQTMKFFDKKEQAKLYCKQQYYLYSGDFPFVKTGEKKGSFYYESTGKREEIEVSDEMECDFKEKYDPYAGVLVVIRGKKIITFSDLNPYSVWDDEEWDCEEGERYYDLE